MKLSIITINYNNASGLQKTMESVFTQTSADFEYIIIDGASTDSSIDIIQQFNSRYLTGSTIQHFQWISEPDKGIYNAMNKGIKKAKGEYIHFLNSGDWLVDENVVENMLNELPECDIIVGNVISVRADGKRRYDINNKNVSLFTFYGSTIQHTSAYIRRSLFDKYGYYDENLKIVSDWKWYLQVAGLNKANVQFTDRFVSCFDKTGISSTLLNLDKEERRMVLEELVPESILADYDKYGFDIIQMQRLKKYPVIYKFVWLIERTLFKVEKWQKKCFAWK